MRKTKKNDTVPPCPPFSDKLFISRKNVKIGNIKQGKIHIYKTVGKKGGTRGDALNKKTRKYQIDVYVLGNKHLNIPTISIANSNYNIVKLPDGKPLELVFVKYAANEAEAAAAIDQKSYLIKEISEWTPIE